MHRRRIEDWIRTHRELLSAEKAFTKAIEAHCAGELTEEQLDTIRQILMAQRELAQVVNAKLEESPRQICAGPASRSASSGQLNGEKLQSPNELRRV